MKPCNLQTTSLDKDGYGRIKHEGKPAQLAHRVAYVRAHGLTLADIKGVIIRHSCDVRNCREPEHLLTGTVQDNVADMVARGRQRQGKPRKLTDEQVRYARNAYSKGAKQTDIAAYLGTTQPIIHQVVTLKTYKEVN